MIELLLISAVALTASLLTLFSGFGLGTLLMPVVALFFPLEVAISMTAIVHLANNLFKVAILGKHAVKRVLVSFGFTAILAAFLGAWFLDWLATSKNVISFSLIGLDFETTGLNIIVGSLILVFVILEFSKTFAQIKLGPKYMPLGGFISGFFGGLSGHQGAFRSMFLLKAGLNKEQFIATGVMIAVMVDVARLTMYGKGLVRNCQFIDWNIVITACLSAFFGAFIGKRVLQKMTIKSVHITVSLLLVVVALGLMMGLI